MGKDDTLMDYTILRSRRKTVSLEITPEGKVLVRAPLRCPKTYIDGFVQSKESWIRKHTLLVHRYQEQQKAFHPRMLEHIGFCGTQLQVVPGERLMLDKRNLRLYMPDATVEQLLPAMEKLYKKEALPWLQERMDEWTKIMGISYKTLRFSTARKRWGSCSVEGDIRITWMLMMAPPEAIDYVLVHELAHRRVFNHSAAFWAVVARYMPDYPQRKQMLKSFSETLYGQGWSRKYS